MTDTLHDMWAVAWHLRYVLRYVLLFGALAFPVATAIALIYRRMWHDAVGLVKVYVDELRIADRYGKTLEARLAAEFIKGSVVLDTTDDDPVFDQGYVYDGRPDWLKALDIPGARRDQR